MNNGKTKIAIDFGGNFFAIDGVSSLNPGEPLDPALGLVLYNLTLEPYLMKQVEMGMDGADILHGHLKTMMYQAEQILDRCIKVEEESGEAIDSMERTEASGYLDALCEVYALTYAIAFVKEDIKNRREILGE
jgi:hypothetical protein